MFEIRDAESIQSFVFGMGLYASAQVTSWKGLTHLYLGTNHLERPFDWYCPNCKVATTWVTSDTNLVSVAALKTMRYVDDFRPLTNVGGIGAQGKKDLSDLTKRVGLFTRVFTCHRCETDLTIYLQRSKNRVIKKIGQYPNLASFQFPEYAATRKELEPQDSKEFGRALGLYSHGVGAGSFVYLRRIFERLIHKRFDQVKGDEGWEDDMFPNRMHEKIEFLKDHLPEFLVGNTNIYSILSMGIHELEEDVCLAGFPVLRDGILEILQEDIERKAALKRKSDTANDIQKLNAALSKPKSADGD